MLPSLSVLNTELLLLSASVCVCVCVQPQVRPHCTHEVLRRPCSWNTVAANHGRLHPEDGK